MAKEIFIMRHAKSSWKDAGLRDFDRPLNDRGRRDAPFMGELLKNKGISPDLIISSPAVRAKTTAEIIADKVEYSGKILFSEQIYEASVSALLSVINAIDNRYSNVFIFGHNPGFTYLAESLSGELFGNLPTCGIIGITFEFDDWAMISSNTGSLSQFEYPKKYQ